MITLQLWGLGPIGITDHYKQITVYEDYNLKSYAHNYYNVSKTL